MTYIHPTAEVEDDVEIGADSQIWRQVHVRRGARLGSQVSVGSNTTIAGGVEIGDLVKINTGVYLCAGVRLGRGVMVGAGTIFTNDRYPRATNPELTERRGSEPDEHTEATVVGEGASVGAGCTIGCGLEIGAFAMVGMGSVVVRSVPAFGLVVGVPARLVGAVCRCGQSIETLAQGEVTCGECGRAYRLVARGGEREVIEAPGECR